MADGLTRNGDATPIDVVALEPDRLELRPPLPLEVWAGERGQRAVVPLPDGSVAVGAPARVVREASALPSAADDDQRRAGGDQ